MLRSLSGVFGDSRERAAKKIQPLVEQIGKYEPVLEALSNAELRSKTGEFKERLALGTSLDDLLPEAFAVVREASRRSVNMRHFDVQLIGGVVLHQGKISEMKTGEGKTLVATLPLYLNALEGKGVHLVTVNDYLARRDCQWMGPIYHSLGLVAGCLEHEAAYVYDPQARSPNPTHDYLRKVSRREAYEADITYGTNHEFGFDYLRDNLAQDLGRVVQRGLRYAIVDEVDYILVDEARTPLIISGPAQESTAIYKQLSGMVPQLQQDQHFTIDEKHRTVTLTDTGIAHMERLLRVGNLYEPANIIYTHHIENALRARFVYHRDRDYVVRDGDVIIVDEFTGRLMPGRRWSEGLHQAVEAREGLKIQQESITHATVTLQNYFRMYHKLAGMTGTAATEAEEFMKIYRLDVVVIPTHSPMVRRDLSDLVYKTERAKWRAITREIQVQHETGRPVLVGTTSIEASEQLSEMLNREGVPHQVLNAKLHEQEAAVVAQAGRLGAVTVATNMAGRGTDIILGGNLDGMLLAELRRRGQGMDTASPQELGELRQELYEKWQPEHEKVVTLGGLHVVGTEKHEARRIDNQFRGRSGRQGDPGQSRFFISLEDDLLRRFGGDRVKSFMDWAGMEEDEPLEHAVVSKAIEQSQMKVEAFHFEQRKHLVEFDDVVNRHRDVIYRDRHNLLGGADLKANVLSMIEKEIRVLLELYLGDTDYEKWDTEGLSRELGNIMLIPEHLQEDQLALMSREEIEEGILRHSHDYYEEAEQTLGVERMRAFERAVMLYTIDNHWVEHLTAMENLRQGVGLQAVGQRDPLVTYRTEGHQRFQDTLSVIQRDIVRTIYHVETGGGQRTQLTQGRRAVRGHAVKASPMEAVARAGSREPVTVVRGPKLGRNEPCHCGSGRKYKKCHGAAT